uniref:Family with sequence similarity 113 n=2 Tax=Gasterosteus aculeatus aculeatus TaxID=481459 RepID=G3Q8S6_GASAC|nr:PC-esterase domain-containing protein 1A-like isoform X1 [Gasterosteus aculeatus aculeatus]XP_040038947.1 PC-esterase domain-containing protein 1A-like isoform X1 [Gasterosteus aculeatus aculeatus]XP_040038948.1 PC-esterase domain-containing protein 1A-like isoform X1 [Gasterosteus aculeatus aculeatus]
MDITKCVSHQQASQLLHNKFVVVLGDSIQRSVYKDLVLLLQKETFLSTRQLKSKGEMCFEQDCLVEGGSFERMHNGTAYREVRQFRSAHHLVRFYFVTRVYSSYMQSFFEDLHNGLKPDVIIFNSCVWDISRYNSSWLENYKENLHTFFAELKRNVPQETLVIWNLTMPLGKRIQGGFLVPEIEHKASHLRYDVIEANFYSGTLADAYGMDVVDLHFQFRFSLQHRTSDGVHWNAIAHRKITSLLLEHSAQAWGVAMPLAAVENTEVAAQWPTNENSTLTERHPLRRNYSYGGEFSNDCWPSDFLTNPQPNYLPQPPLGNGFDYRPPNRHHQQNVMRRQRVKLHYVPYAHPRYRH